MIREADVDGDGQINYEGEQCALYALLFAIYSPPFPYCTEFVKVCTTCLLLVSITLTRYSADDAVEVKECCTSSSLPTLLCVRYLYPEHSVYNRENSTRLHPLVALNRVKITFLPRKRSIPRADLELS